MYLVATRPAIRLHEIEKDYPTTRALRGVSLEIPLGTSFGILGPNGAGKSTLLNILAGVTRPTRGTITVGGVPLDGAREFREYLQYSPQVPVLFEYLTVRENLQLVAELNDRDPRTYPAEIGRLIAELGMDSKRDDLARTLSGGQRQRLNLMLALVGAPRVLLLDEPTTGLDIQSRLVIHRVVRRLGNHGITVILSTHDFTEAQALCDRIIFLDAGRVVLAGTPREIITDRARQDHVVELSEVTSGDLLPALDDLRDALPQVAWVKDIGGRAAGSGGIVEVGIKGDMNALNVVLTRLRALGGFAHFTVRPTTLADIFLDVTHDHLSPEREALARG